MAKSLEDLLKENVKESNNEEIKEIDINLIKPNPYQPRHFFDSAKIDELAASIKEHGIIQPIILKPVGAHYIIIAGERRYKASIKLGLKTIPAIIRTYEKSKMMELALIENLQRENLSPIEEAQAYVQMMKELGYNHSEVASKVGKSRSYVTNLVGILKLPQEVLFYLENGSISLGHARALSKLKDDNQIITLAKIIIEEGLNVRDIETLSKKFDKKNNINLKNKKDRIIYNKVFADKKIKIIEDKDKITIKVSDGKIKEIVDWILKELN